MSKQRADTKAIAYRNELEQRATQHQHVVAQYKQQIGKLLLVGFSGQGIERSYLQAVEGEMVGAIALKFCADKDGLNGMFFDVTQCRIYKIYDDIETAKFEEEKASIKR